MASGGRAAEVRLLRNPKKREGGVEKKARSEGAQLPMDEENWGRHERAGVKSAEGGRGRGSDGGEERWMERERRG